MIFSRFFLPNFYKIALNKSLFLAKRYKSTEFSEILSSEDVQTFLQSLTGNLDKFTRGSTVEQLVKKKKQLENELVSLNSMNEKSSEMLELIEEEKSSFLASIQEVDKEILLELLPQKNINRDVMIEVSAGVGGKEAMHFASDLLDMYAGYSLHKRWNWEVQEAEIPESGGIRHASAFVSGIGAERSLLQESGVHRVQRVPATEKAGRVHTSTVTVAVLPQPTEVELVIRDKDLKMETKTSSGAGGQHVNKTESCVRITHIPTGIVIENQTDRSQIRNKKLALQRLRSKLYQMEIDGLQSKTHQSRKEQMGSSMRSEKIRTYNFNQDRITDHRIGVTVHDLPRFMKGGPELDQLITQLIDYDQTQQLLKIIQEQLRSFKKGDQVKSA